MIRRLFLFMLVLGALRAAAPAAAQGMEFVYQGQLKDGGQVVSGAYDFRFRLFDAATAGGQVGPTLCVDGVPVDQGLFSVRLDFGQQFITTGGRFLELEVRPEIGQPCSDDFAYVRMTPRQAVTASPLSLSAKSAFSLAAADGSPAGAVVVDASGKVGIGAAAPTHTLHIASVEPTLALQDTDSTQQQVGFVSFRDSANAERAWLGYGTAGSADFSIVNARGGDLVINPIGGNLDVLADLFATGSIVTSHADVGAIRTQNLGVSAGAVGVLADIGTVNATNCTGVTGRVNSSDPTCFGVFARGRLGATGTKSFRIDHPEKPRTHYLYHYSTESPEALNFYRGTVTLDADGRAAVQLPTYFAKINKDPSYQLTAIGAPMPLLHVAEPISDEALREGEEQPMGVTGPACGFVIAGGAPGGRVSWRVEALRNDAFVREGGAPSEVERPEEGLRMAGDAPGAEGR